MDKTVYIADDDEDDRELFKAAICDSGENVTLVESSSGDELVEKMRSSDDLSDSIAVVDMNMPRMNGLETIAAIKSDPDLKDVPAVLMTTSSSTSLAEQAIEAGANQFVTKPTSFLGLIEVIKKMLKIFFS